MGPVPMPGGTSGAAEVAPIGIDRPPRTMDLRKVTTPLLLHLLRGELRFLGLFLLRCQLTVGQCKKRIDPRFPAELIELAALPLRVSINLKQRLGPVKACEIMRVAILTGGVAQWNLAYETVAKQRTFADLCDQELEVNQAGPSRWHTLEVVDHTTGRFAIKITRCLYHALTTSLGVPPITPVICQIDNAAFNAYLPDRVIFHRGGPGNRIADGQSACRFVWEIKE